MRMRRGAIARLGPALVIALVLSLALPEQSARAHQVGLSQGRYDLRGAALVGKLVFANLELSYALPELDGDHDGAISRAELERGGTILARQLVDRIGVTGDGVACPVTLTSAALGDQDAVQVTLEARCAVRPRALQIHCGFLPLLAASHRHLAAISTRADLPAREAMAVAGQMDLTADVAADAGGAPRAGTFKALLRLGVEHILTGYDHLVFLFGLIVLGGRPRSLVAALTAFTLSHSLSLALAVLGIWAPRPSIIEPAIALSIAYVGVENLWWTHRRDASRAPSDAAAGADVARGRWRITFPFGLVHGFGFAGALAAIGLPRERVPGALLAFNLGVEIGQLGVLAVVLPALTWARRWRFVRGPVTTAANLAIVAAGIVWLMARLRA